MGNVTHRDQWAAAKRLRFIERRAWWHEVGLLLREPTKEVSRQLVLATGQGRRIRIRYLSAHLRLDEENLPPHLGWDTEKAGRSKKEG